MYSILKKNVQSVTICYDSDSAGIDAAFRAGNMLQQASCLVKVAMMPDGMDPDEYIKKYGEENFVNEVIGASLTLMAFKLLYFRKGKNIQNEGDRLQYIEEILKEIAILIKRWRRDHYLRQLADEFSLSLRCIERSATSVCSMTLKKENVHNKAACHKPIDCNTKADELKPAHL